MVGLRRGGIFGSLFKNSVNYQRSSATPCTRHLFLNNLDARWEICSLMQLNRMAVDTRHSWEYSPSAILNMGLVKVCILNKEASGPWPQLGILARIPGRRMENFSPRIWPYQKKNCSYAHVEVLQRKYEIPTQSPQDGHPLTSPILIYQLPGSVSLSYFQIRSVSQRL